MDARQRMRTMKQATELTGSGAINVGGTMKLSTLIGNNGQGKGKGKNVSTY